MSKQKVIRKAMGKGGPTLDQIKRTNSITGNKPRETADGNTAMDAFKRFNPVLGTARAAQSGVKYVENKAKALRGFLSRKFGKK